MQERTKPRISRETASEDLRRIAQQFGTIGNGSENKAAQLIMHTIRVLESRLGNPSFIKKVYFDGHNSSELLPPIVSEVAQQYSCGEITEPEAKRKLREASKQYSDIFQETGVTLQESTALFPRR